MVHETVRMTKLKIYVRQEKIHQQCRCRVERNGYGEKTY